MELKDAHFLLKELKSNECSCGNYKKEGNSFCFKCYSALPPDKQRNLYRRFGNGYEESYEDAFEWLENNHWK